MKPKRKGFTGEQWLILITVMIASFLGRLDGTVVNLALPKMISDFGITVSQASWISTAYIIANAIFVPIFGKLGDLIGKKPLYLFGIIGFVITSAFAGLSFNLSSILFFRVLQAITVSIDYPLALSIIAVDFSDPDQRAMAMGMWSGIFAVAAVFGPLLGGPLIDNFTWRSVFYINIPIGILATLMAIRFIKEPVQKIKGIKNFDIAGSLLLGLALGVLVLVLDQGQTWGWGSAKSIISYLIIGASFALFIWVEHHQKEPVVDLKFFKIPAFSAAIITSFISFMGMIGGIFLIPIFVQTYLGYSVTKTGYLFIPMAVALMLAANLGASLSRRIEARYLTAAGMILAAIALFWFAGIDIKWGAWDIIIRLSLFAFGLGLGLAPLTTAATSTVPIHEVGIASSVLALARNIAGAFGIAIFATILSDSFDLNVLQIQAHSVLNSKSPQLLQLVAGLVAVKANILSFGTVFEVAAVFMLMGAVAALLVKVSSRKVQVGKAQTAEVEVGI